MTPAECELIYHALIGENTLQMLIDASRYRGMERAVVRNICRLYALEKEYAIR